MIELVTFFTFIVSLQIAIMAIKNLQDFGKTMKSAILIDGKLPGKKELLHLLEGRELFIGRTPFTSVLLCDGKIPFWELHLKRLKSSFDYLYPTYNFSIFKEKIDLSLRELPKTKGSFYLRFTMIEVENDIKLICHLKKMIVKESDGLKLKTFPHPARVSSLPSFLKYGNYLEAITHVTKAKSEGFDDCLFLDKDDLAAECSTSNIFFRKGERFFTPPLSGPVLDGITRNIVINIISSLGHECEELAANRAEWENMDEIFMTNSLKGLIGISQIDNRTFEFESQILKKMKELYQKKLSQND